jgi:outer membrane protein TolC
MGACKRRLFIGILCLEWLVSAAGAAIAQEQWRAIFPEQRRIQVRSPSQMPVARLPDLPPPPTVSDRLEFGQTLEMSLDDAIRIALANSEVIRVLAGTRASSSGRTIYDPAISNTQIDDARARFDPAIRQFNNLFNRDRVPGAIPSNDPAGARIVDNTGHDYSLSLGAEKTGVTGGTAGLGVNTIDATNAANFPLNPQSRSNVELSYVQPLLKGAGCRVNLAPIVIARIDTERSFFQMKESVQRLVVGVIEAYWAVVFARTDLWARQQQVAQGQEGYNFADAQFRTGRRAVGDVAQARSALANFRANLVGARANLLQREAALREILGLPPEDGMQIVPVTPPVTERLEIDWNEAVALTEEFRPDLIELKLILEADEEQLLLADNLALPQVDAVARYHWNGLEGRTPNRSYLAADPNEFTGWQVGVNFSVPLGLRKSRAALRQRELVIMRDRANLHQGLHNAAHALAASYRRLDQFYDQYKAFQEARIAARLDLNSRMAEHQSGRPTLYLNVLQAITTWGNSVSAESQTLAQYNSELAALELETGTVLESHGIRFTEERFGSIGPTGRLFPDRCYPRDLLPDTDVETYRRGTEPSESVFDLEDPLAPYRDRARKAPLPPPARQPDPVLPEIP